MKVRLPQALSLLLAAASVIYAQAPAQGKANRPDRLEPNPMGRIPDPQRCPERCYSKRANA
jgi:hypothetical protein